MAKASGAKRLRFARLHLENWRNFVEADLIFGGRAFLVGPNASGKSNLLDALRFLHQIAAIGGGFQAAVSSRGGVKGLRCLAARRYSDIRLQVEIGDGEEAPIWGYDLVFNQDNQRRPLVKRETVFKLGRKIVERPDRRDEKDTERLTQTYLEQVHANQAFRDVAEFLRSIRYLHIVPQLVREPDRSVGRANDPFGGDFLEQIADTRVNVQRARLRRIKDALVVAVPQLKQLELHRDAKGTPHLRGNYEHWRPQGAWQTEEEFSDGTLRLLGLLWAVLDGAGPLLLEEPELSLHPEVVRYIPQMFARALRSKGRQIIASTHSSDLLLDAGIGLDEVFLLQPSSEGTSVNEAGEFGQVVALLEAGVSLGEAVMPRTSPNKLEQLSLFGA